jgi:colanic acid/amylovoran biosynthesis glycosyltransferase
VTVNQILSPRGVSASGERRPDDPDRITILAYRDHLVPRSEASFLRRLYIGFERLDPIWVGRRRGDGLSDLAVEPVLLGRSGMLGALDREIFKHLGVLPPVPDLRAMRPRLVHAHFGRGGALALPIARSLGIPLVVSFYGGDATKSRHYERHLLPAIYKRRLPALQRDAALFICVSHFIRDQLIARGFPGEKLIVHRFGVNLDIPDGADDAGGDRYVLFAGRFVEKKGAGYLIEAVRRLEGDGRDLRLVMIGNGPLTDDLKRAAAALKQVEFIDWVPNSELRRWMRGALALCVPSLQASDGDAEGLPTVVLEAMAAGTPVIGSRHAGIGEAVEDERTGFLVAEQDPEALAAALRRLSDEPGLRKRLGENARAVALERFDMVRQSRRLEEKLLSIIRSAPAIGNQDV